MLDQIRQQNERFLEALKNDQSTKNLEISDNHGTFTIEDFIKLKEVLPSTAIETLTFAKFFLDKKSIECICDIITQCTSITTLRMYSSNITPDALSILVDSLKHNRSLTHLDLNSVNIRSYGLSLFKSVIRHNTKLEYIGIVSNWGVSNESHSALLNALKFHNLSILKFDGICFDEAETVERCLEQNKSVQDFVKNPDYVDYTVEVLKFLSKNEYHTHFLYYIGVCNTKKKGGMQIGDLSIFPNDLLREIFTYCSFNLHGERITIARNALNNVMEEIKCAQQAVVVARN